MEQSSSRYAALMNDMSVYEQDLIVEQLQKTNLNRLMTTDFERERWARHLKVCFLLCNTELKPPEISVKRVKTGTASTSSSSSGSENQPHDFRYYCIEMQSNQSTFQNDILLRMGVNRSLSRCYDIYDSLLNKFIEVKVSANPEARYADFNNYRDLVVETGLAVVHPVSGETTYYEMERMPGHEKVVKFILQRARAMLTHELNVNALEYETDLVEEIFPSSYLNELTEEFMSDMVGALDEKIEIEDYKFQYHLVDKDTLNSRIEDPREREAPPIKWPAKISPIMWLEGIETNSTEDKEMITDLFYEFKNDFQEHWLASTVNSWNSSSSTYCLFKERESGKQNKTLVEKLGVGMKSRVRVDNDTETKQKEYGKRESLKYHFWFENLLSDFSEKTADKIDVTHLTRTAPPITQMDHISIDASKRLVEEYSGRVISQQVLYNINFYSRLAGSYAPKNSDSTGHSNAVIFPLYCTTKTEKEKIRKVYGFVIRAPQHARNCNDKINMIIVERYNNKERTKMYMKYIRKHEVLASRNGACWIIRQQAIEKMDPAYLTFLENSLYTPSNLIGELLLPKRRHDLSELQVEIENFIDDYGDWLIERIVESVVIALTSRSADEGSFAMIRKIFMICLALKRNQPIGLMSVEEFGDKVNECLLNNCMGMYYVCQLKDILTNLPSTQRGDEDIWKNN